MAVETGRVEDAVEAHHPGEIQIGAGPGYERQRSTEAEPDGDRRTGPGSLAQLRRRGGEVVDRLVELHLLTVRAVVELVVARAEAGGPAVVVEGNRVMAGLREALGQLDVEGVEAANVRDDHDTGLVALGCLGERRREVRAVV